MPSGGKRANSGRKSEAELETIRAAIDNNITPKQWDTIIKKLYTLAEKGNIRATQILISYRFGAATAQLRESESIADSPNDTQRSHDHWYLLIFPQDNPVMALEINETNGTFDDKGNVIISRRSLYTFDPPPFVPQDPVVFSTLR